MPMPWRAILYSVPWRDVIANAPRIAENAHKLWKKLGKNGNTQLSGSNEMPPVPPNVTSTERIAILEVAYRELRDELVASGEIIQALGEQNARLVAEIDTQRRHTRRLYRLLLALTILLALAALLTAYLPR